MGGASSVILTPEEKRDLTKAMEKKYAELQQEGAVSEVDLYNTISQ